MISSVLPQQIPTGTEAGRDPALRGPVGVTGQPYLVIFCALVLVVTPDLHAQIGNDNPTGTSGVFNGNITTGCSYDPYTSNATRSVTDIAVAGSVGAYPLAFTRTMNTRYTPGTGTLEFGQAGTWRHNYQWSIDAISFDDSGPNRWYAMPGSYWVNYPDGRRILMGTHQSGDPNLHAVSGVGDRFQPLTGAWGGDCYLLLSDGGKVWFSVDVSRNGDDVGAVTSTFTFTFMGIIDPYGQVTSVSYPGDGSMTITEPRGRWLKLFYITTPWNGDTVIDTVAASDGRSVKYNYGGYTTPNGTVYTFLGNIVYFNDPTQVAIYSYQNDNVDPNGRPLIQWAIDCMYGGPMWAIGYTFVPGSSGGVYGQIQSENYLDPSNGAIGGAVSTLGINGNSRTETRGDGPARTFNYSGGSLMNYTDFKGVTSSIGYNGYGYNASFTDARGNTTSTSREPRIGALTVLTHPGDNSTASVGYSDANNPYYVSNRTDERGNTTWFTRNGNHQVERIDYPNGGYETFAYNGFGQPYFHRMTSGGTETFYLDVRGMMYASSNPDGTTYYYYDGLDRLEHVTDARSNSTWFQYNARGQVTRVTHMDQSFVQFGYDNHGDRISVTDELNHTTNYVYDYYKRLVSVTNPLNQTANLSYAPWNGSGNYSHTTSLPRWSTSPQGKTIHFDYDENMRRIVFRQAPGTTDDAWTWSGYDPAGNLSSVSDPRGQTTSFGYDARNRRESLTNALNQTTAWQYDATNNLLRETRPDQSFRRAEFDSMNRVIDTYGFAGEHTHYERDPAGNVTQMIDAKGASYAFVYDSLNRKTTATYPTDATGADRTETWSYTTGGVLDYHVSPAGQYQRFHFDSRNRLDHSWWDNGVGPDIATTFDFANRVANVSTNGGETIVSFGYDAANRQTSEDQAYTGFATHHVAMEVDGDGMRNHFTADGWYELRYDFTARNQLRHICDNAGNPWFTYNYDVAGNMTKRQDGMWGVNDSTNVIDGNGVNQYDPLNRPVMWENSGGGDNPFARSWQQYDNVGRMTATWRDEQGSKGERFGYDAIGQLTSAAYNADQVWTGNAYNPSRTVSYGVDALNRHSVTENGTATGYSPNSLNQYTNVGGQGYGYDGHFNLTSLPGFSANFNAASQLASATNNGNSAQFTYDGLGRCVKRTINGVTNYFVYDGWKPVIEMDASQNLLAYNVYGAGADEILWRYQVGGGHLRYHHDARGNVIFILDGGGNGIEKYTYDVFGQPTITDWGGNVRSQSAYGNRFMFTGREYFPELGIYDYRNRFYHPGLGRFLQSDPIGFRGGDANIFRYCGGDPVNYADPSGLGILDWIKKYFTEDKNSGPGTATTQRVIVTGSSVETAETAGPGFRGAAGPLDFSGGLAGEGSARETGGGGGGGYTPEELAKIPSTEPVVVHSTPLPPRTAPASVIPPPALGPALRSLVPVFIYTGGLLYKGYIEQQRVASHLLPGETAYIQTPSAYFLGAFFARDVYLRIYRVDYEHVESEFVYEGGG